MSPAHVFSVQHTLLSCLPQLHPLAPAPTPEHAPPWQSKGGAPLGGTTVIGRQLSRQAALKSGNPTSRDYRMTALLLTFNFTFYHSICFVAHVTYFAHLHQIPEVNMAIFWTAQNVCVFIGQTAVEFIAFIDMTRVPVKGHHIHTHIIKLFSPCF